MMRAFASFGELVPSIVFVVFVLSYLVLKPFLSTLNLARKNPLSRCDFGILRCDFAIFFKL